MEPFDENLIKNNIKNYTYELFLKGINGLSDFLVPLMRAEHGNVIERNYICRDAGRKSCHRLTRNKNSDNKYNQSDNWVKDPKAKYLNIILNELRHISRQYFLKLENEAKKQKEYHQLVKTQSGHFVEKRKTRRLPSCYSSDSESHDPDFKIWYHNTPWKPHDEIRKSMKEFRESIPKCDFEIEEDIADIEIKDPESKELTDQEKQSYTKSESFSEQSKELTDQENKFFEANNKIRTLEIDLGESKGYIKASKENIGSKTINNNKTYIVNKTTNIITTHMEPFDDNLIKNNIENYTYQLFLKGMVGLSEFLIPLMKAKHGDVIERNYICGDVERKSCHRLTRKKILMTNNRTRGIREVVHRGLRIRKRNI